MADELQVLAEAGVPEPESCDVDPAVRVSEPEMAGAPLTITVTAQTPTPPFMNVSCH